MIRLGLRLAVAGGREAVVRLALIAAAVAVGVGLLLGVLSAVNAVQSQNQRYAWLNSGVLDAATGSEAADPAWWGVRKDFIRGHPAARIDVAATGPDAPVPPGL
ncbi:MAG TPA: ABC transporter permease, partial [Actinoplanes sp.]